MHVLLLALLILALAPGQASADPPTFAGVSLAGVEASSSLDTTWPWGLGPRLPPALAWARAVDPPPPPVLYGPTRALDGDPRTAWVPGDSGIESWLRLDLGGERFIEELVITGGGQLGEEPPERNSRVRSVSISAPNTVIDLPSRTFELADRVDPQPLPLHGHVYDSVNLTFEQLFQGPSDRLPIAEISGRILNLDPAAVRAALELPEGASMSAIRSPGGGGSYIVAWSGLVDERLHAELVGISGSGADVRVLWREPVTLQWRGAQSVDLLMEPVSFGGPPAILLNYRFMEVGTTLAFARVYVIGGAGASPAWETSLIGDVGGQTTRTLRFSSGQALIATHDEDLGYGMVQEVYRYDPAFRQFEPAPNRVQGVTTRVATASGAAVSGAERLYDGTGERAVIVPGEGVGATIRLRFDQPRRLSAIRLLPGSTEIDAEGRTPGYTRPSTLRLEWPGGYQLETELENAPEAQVIFEGWDGPAAAATEEITLVVTGVYPAVPGDRMAIGELEVYFLDPP